MNKKTFILALGVALALTMIAGCSSEKHVKDINDVNIISDHNTVEGVASDSGVDTVSSDLVDLGDLTGQNSTMEDSATSVGIDKADPGLIEIGELI